MSATGAFLAAPQGPRLSREEASFFAATNPFGFLIEKRNVEDGEQLAWLVTELRAAVGRDAPVFIDREGGRATRFGIAGWRDFLPAREQVAQNKRGAARAMYLRHRLMAHELQALGIDGDFSPVIDLAIPETEADLAGRCYGDGAVAVAEIAAFAAEGLIDGGVLPVVKHLPGMGRAQVSPMQELPVITAKEKALRVSDFLAAEAVSGLPIGLVGHAIYREIDASRPASMSRPVMQIIRQKIGFNGLLIADEITTPSLPGSVPERAIKAIGGCGWGDARRGAQTGGSGACMAPRAAAH